MTTNCFSPCLEKSSTTFRGPIADCRSPRLAKSRLSEPCCLSAKTSAKLHFRIADGIPFELDPGKHLQTRHSPRLADSSKTRSTVPDRNGAVRRTVRNLSTALD